MLADRNKVDAIAWGAKREGVSYGQFSVSLTEKKKQQVYAEYESYLYEKEEEEKARLSRGKKTTKNK